MGSTFARATIIQGDIYEKAAPVPDIAASLERNRFVHEVIAAVKETAEECKIELR